MNNPIGEFKRQPGEKELLDLALRWSNSFSEIERRNFLIKTEIKKTNIPEKLFEYFFDKDPSYFFLPRLINVDDKIIINYIHGVELRIEFTLALIEEGKFNEYKLNNLTPLPRHIIYLSEVSGRLVKPYYKLFLGFLNSIDYQEYLLEISLSNDPLSLSVYPGIINSTTYKEKLKLFLRKNRSKAPHSISEVYDLKEEMLIEEIKSMQKIRSATGTQINISPITIFIYYLNGKESFKIKLIEFLKEQYPIGKGAESARMVFALEECDLINTPENKADLVRSIIDEWGLSYEAKDYESFNKYYRKYNRIRNTKNTRKPEEFEKKLILEITKINDFKTNSCTT
jgi:hypothetical protein